MADALLDRLHSAYTTWRHNLSDGFANMTPEKYIRLIVVVGAYLLLRPYIMRLGAKVQAAEHEKEIDHSQLQGAKAGSSAGAKAGAGKQATAAISPNSLRGRVTVPEDSDSEGEEAAGNGATGKDVGWGKKARRRQRQMVRRVLEADEKLRREQEEDEEDKDIEEFLTG